jgi:hypothetical protein
MVLANGVSASLSGDTRSNWWLHLDGGRNLRRMDDDDVRRGGPVIRRPAENWVHFQIDTDDRRPLSFTLRPEVKRHDGGASHERSLTLAAAWRPRPSLWFSVAPVYVHGVADAQWVQTDPDPAAPGGVHYVYGRLDRQTLDLTTRAQVNFAPELSLELYLQPFVAIGDFRSFKELVAARTYRFQPYALPQDHDFHHRWLNSNLVLRWEFRPGSALYAIWSQARYASQSQVTAGDLELRPLRRLASAFTDPGSNVFLVKVSRWYGR